MGTDDDMDMEKQLLDLQKKIYRQDADEGEYILGEDAKLYFFPVGEEGYDLYFYGDGNDPNPETSAAELEAGRNNDEEDYANIPYCTFLDFLCEQKHADRIVSLTFDGPDHGEHGDDGLKVWNFGRIVKSDVVFPALKSFRVQSSDLGSGNESIIAIDSFESEGMLGGLLAKMPVVETLTISQANDLDETFFQVGSRTLRHLRVNGGSDNGFIRALAENSDAFPQLTAFEYTDYLDRDPKTSPEDFVPFEDYKALFQSKAFDTVREFVLRNARLTDPQLVELQRIRPELSFLYIDARNTRYVSWLLCGI